MENGRAIGIRHRIKVDAKGRRRPTKVAILEGKKTISLNLRTEDDELNFLLNRFEGPGKRTYGLQPGDIVAMVFGGSGDNLVAALSRRGEEIGARVMRIPSFVLSENRNGADKADDHRTLARLVKQSPNLFYAIGPRDRDIIRVGEAFSARQEAVKARIACQQRLFQWVIGRIFLNEQGRFPEGQIKDAYDEERANDTILKALLAEEKRRENELKNAVHALDIWHELFAPIKGCGERIAGGIISAIADIRRFERPAKLKAFCGVHVLDDGRLPRKRMGQIANWNPLARQSLYLLAEQFNRQQQSGWGKKLIENKERLRLKHPKPIKEGGKTRYNDGHIHNMAIWRTLTQFVVWLHREWWAIERRHQEAADEAAV